jgi:hypothetical protein
MEESPATIQPGQGIANAIELRELHLVSCGMVVVANVPCIGVPSALSGAGWRAMISRHALRNLDVFDRVTLLLVVLILVGHRRL